MKINEQSNTNKLSEKKDIKNENRYKKSKALKLYQSEKNRWDSLIRSFAGTVPYAGTAIGELLTYKWTSIREKRLEEAFSQIACLIQEMGESKIDKQYLNSEGFQHLLIVCLEQIIREHREKKRECFVNLLVNAMKKEKDVAKDQAEWFADVLSRMSFFHILAFKLIKANQKERELIFNSLIKTQADRQALISCAKDLESAGFITNFPSVMFAINIYDIVDVVFQKLTLTKAGEAFINWISTPIETKDSKNNTGVTK